MLEQIFENYIHQSRPLLTKIENVYDQLRYVQEILRFDSTVEYSFQMTPCMTALLTHDFLEKTSQADSRAGCLHRNFEKLFTIRMSAT